jgi:hypothetical protein
MAPIVSKGYYPNSSADVDQDWQLFCQNVQLLLQHQQTILACSDYFFCSPSFSYCSWPWTSGDGPLVIGYLLLSWQNRLLVQSCPDSGCGVQVLITSFSGSPLSGANSWAGYCTNCRSRKSGSRTDIRFYELVDFVSKLRQKFPATVQQIEEYDAFEFSFGGDGLKPVIKKKVVQVPVAEPVNFATLLLELKAGTIRKGRPVNVYLLKKEYELKLSKSTQKNSVHMKL